MLKSFKWALVAILLLPVYSDGAEVAGQLPGAEYSPRGLYDPEVYTLDNGLTVILKSRRHLPEVSIRALVDLGSAHFPCGQKEVPHYLEHMLFDAVPELTEAELWQLVSASGGSMNAIAGREATVYYVDVFSQNTPVMLEMLSNMLFSGKLTENAYDLAEEIIRHEHGGDETALEWLLHFFGTPRTAMSWLAEARSANYFGYCPILLSGKSMQYQDIVDAYEDYYRPDNITLVMVGDFALTEARQWIAQYFGGVNPREGPRPWRVHLETDFGGSTFRGSRGTATVGVVALTDGLIAEDFYARIFLVNYLEDRLFQRLRLDAGLTYTPTVRHRINRSYGHVWMQATMDTPDTEAVLDIIHEEIALLREEPLSHESFSELQRGILMRWSTLTETNKAFAEHYVTSLEEWREFGRFRNDEVELASLTPESVQAVAQEIFAQDQLIILRDQPFYARIQKGILQGVGAIFLIILALLLRGYWRRRKHSPIPE